MLPSLQAEQDFVQEAAPPTSPLATNSFSAFGGVMVDDTTPSKNGKEAEDLDLLLTSTSKMSLQDASDTQNGAIDTPHKVAPGGRAKRGV